MDTAPGRPESDASLVARFQGGDEGAFDLLVVRHREGIYRLARRITGHHADADDVAQEAFLRAYRGLHKFRGEAAFRTWLTRIAINLAVRRPGSAATVSLEETAAPVAVAAGGEGLLRRQVRGAVDALPRRQRQVMVLKAYGGLTFAEIAVAAGMSVGTAKATFFQAVQKLRERLAGPPETRVRRAG